MDIAMKPQAGVVMNRPAVAPKQAAKDVESDSFVGLVRDGFEFIGNSVSTMAGETVKLVENDPMLAFRTAATSLAQSGPVLTGLNSALKAGFAATMPVTIRGALLVGDSLQAYSTMKNPSATTLDKAVDVGAVVNDVVGLAGGIAMLAAGGPVAAAGVAVLGASYGVDLLAHTYRGLKHGKARIDTIRQQRAEEQSQVKQEQNEAKSA